jgi:hypothetical protein
MTKDSHFQQAVSAQIRKYLQYQPGLDELVKTPCEPRRCKKSRPANVKLDAFIAEIAKIIDASLLEHDPDFETLWRPHRMHIIMACLARCDIARTQKLDGGRRWRATRRWRRNVAAKYHGSPDELERIEAPIGNSTLADKFSKVLRTNAEAVEDVADFVLRIFEIRFF